MSLNRIRVHIIVMDISKFEAGSFERQYQYESFLPNEINKEWVLSDPKTLTMLDDASRVIGELNAFSQLVPDVDFFIQMHITKEATKSSRIEGTRTNIDEALVSEEDVDPEKQDDWTEVQNYIRSMREAIAALEHLPLSNRLLRTAHLTLMQGVRGQQKLPGEFRTSQNWIGVNLKNAVFVPPHHEKLAELMGDLERFMHNDKDHVPHLVKVAILHYQFETIHPFLDGNGRLGRLMITLYLVQFGLLEKPALYLSDFFERHKSDYYDRLTDVRLKNDLLEWIRFFLIGVRETALRSIGVFKEIIILRESVERKINTTIHGRKRENALSLAHHLYASPIVSVGRVSALLKIQHNTANSLVGDFEGMGILRNVAGNKRNRLFIYHEYVSLFRD